MKKEGSRLSLQRYVQSKACRHALDSNRQGEASAALKIIPSLGLMEVSFPQNDGSLLAAQRGYQGGLQLALLCVPGGWLGVFKHFGTSCFEGKYANANYSLTYLLL